MTRARAAPLVALAAAACAAHGLDPERFCRDLAAARCASIARCCAPGESPLPAGEAACREAVLGQCDAVVADALRRGTARFDAEAAAACVAQAGACGAHLVAFCEAATRGVRLDGEHCVANGDCAPPGVCLPLEPGPQGRRSACFAPQPVGGACDAPERFCGPDAFCDAGALTCAGAPAEGEPCAGPCRLGLACSGGICHPLAPAGAPCAAPYECAGGLCTGGACTEPCAG